MIALYLYPAYRPPAARFPIQAEQTLAAFGPQDNLWLQDVVYAERGDWLLVQLSWEVRAPLEADYQLFLHARANPFWILAQRDTLPGLGHRLLSELPPGTRFTDVYPLPRVPGQTVTSLALGFWLPTDTGWERLPHHQRALQGV
ncbi:MAG: hypothetical protein HC915_16455 [Anaerolineae bacterium]|nr:hypothetical protein [Anaerolineae bacterium]